LLRTTVKEAVKPRSNPQMRCKKDVRGQSRRIIPALRSQQAHETLLPLDLRTGNSKATSRRPPPRIRVQEPSNSPHPASIVHSFIYPITISHMTSTTHSYKADAPRRCTAALARALLARSLCARVQGRRRGALPGGPGVVGGECRSPNGPAAGLPLLLSALRDKQRRTTLTLWGEGRAR
jgi:hypothetical protein